MKKVLIMEDELNIRSFVVINLRRAGYDVIDYEYAREKGIFVDDIKLWRDACISANGSVAKEAAMYKKELKSSEKEIKRLEKELNRKNAALAETAALLVLRKKADAIWGDPGDE